MSKRLLVCGIASIVIVMLLAQFRSSPKTSFTDVERLRAFDSLLEDWTLTFPIPHNVVEYECRPTRSEWGTVLEYFKLELTADGAEKLLLEPEWQNTYAWTPADELLPVRPTLEWWTVDGRSNHFTASFLSTDRVQFIRFYLFTDVHQPHMLVKSLSRKGAVKHWRTN
jgi:hypothetical protein